ncbi:Fic family protein [Lysinibacillus sp. FSL K6-0057]|uniref:Fic family protein n=1 Tax=Lysinibacillus sp. FSL K6-0057 TaxID=2921411 RepID=UPI003159A03E
MCNGILSKLQEEGTWGTLEEAAKKLAYYKAELNLLHPFREGNGRTIRLFIYLYALNKGFLWEYVDLGSEEYMQAMNCFKDR